MSDLLRDKSFEFALRTVKLSEFLHKEKSEYVLSRKILDAATNIGLFIEEAKQGSDRADFINKYSLANKEAFKANFLLRLLGDSEKISGPKFDGLLSECEELQKMLIASLKTARQREHY